MSPSSADKKNIVIVGGGIIGSTTAYFLTRHPSFNPTHHTITLIEATAIASGSSGKAGGLLALWAYPSCLVPLSFRLHAELSAAHGGAERWGYRRLGVGELSARGRQIGTASGKEEKKGPKLNGSEVVGSTHRVSLQKRTKESFQNLKRAGVPEDLDWFADECVQSYDSMGTPENTAQVHPYQFTTSMAKLAEEQGINIVLGTVDQIKISSSSSGAVDSISYTEKESGERKTLPATDVVITAGPWTKTVWPTAPISALRAHSVTIRPSRPISAYAIFTSIALPKDFRTGGGGTKSPAAQHVSPEIYTRPNNEIYACGEGDHLVPLPSTTAEVEVDQSRCQDIIDHVSSISDELRDGEVLVRQACYLPQVETGGGPLVGPTPTKGVWMAAGHTCWGIQNGPGTGKIMAEFVMDGKATSARVGSLDPRRVL